jgi:Zn-dependent peptidase ImmA (M78 family)
MLRNLMAERGRRSLSERPTDSGEAYADDFAMSLLMPETDVRTTYRKGGGWAEMVVAYGVPAEIAIRRMNELGLAVRV